MAKLNEYKKMKITDICTYERAKKGKIYKTGNFCIQVSATKGQTIYLENDTEVDSKYLVFNVIDKNIHYPKYIYLVFMKDISAFLRKMQTGLNILPEIFNDYEIDVHQDIQTQQHIAELYFVLDERIRQEEEIINDIVEFKKYHLCKMFC